MCTSAIAPGSQRAPSHSQGASAIGPHPNRAIRFAGSRSSLLGAQPRGEGACGWDGVGGARRLRRLR
eukprot:10479051-Alexandrium_andersonii.AAC.1